MSSPEANALNFWHAGSYDVSTISRSLEGNWNSVTPIGLTSIPSYCIPIQHLTKLTFGEANSAREAGKARQCKLHSKLEKIVDARCTLLLPHMDNLITVFKSMKVAARFYIFTTQVAPSTKSLVYIGRRII